MISQCLVSRCMLYSGVGSSHLLLVGNQESSDNIVSGASGGALWSAAREEASNLALGFFFMNV